MQNLNSLPQEAADRIRLALRLRSESLKVLREYMTLGQIDKAQPLIASVRELEAAMGWGGIPIDQEDFMGKSATGTQPISGLYKLYQALAESVAKFERAKAVTNQAPRPFFCKPAQSFTVW